LNIDHTTMLQIAAVMAFTEEGELLYPVLTRCMRSTGYAKRLHAFLPYIFYLDSALRALPAFTGTVYRGVNVRLNPSLYATGSTITWQHFTSATKRPLVTLNFLSVTGSRVSGSLFIVGSVIGKEVEELSEFPCEEQVVFNLNSFFKVEQGPSNNAEKLALMPDLGAYNLNDVDIYVLQQLG